MDSGDDPVGYVMCAINAYSSVLVLPRSSWSSWSTATHRLSPRACALLGQLAELAAASELAQLAGRCGAGVCACVCAACVRACGVCARVVFACVRRACVRVRCWRACGCARALAVQLTTATLSATGIRKTVAGEFVVCDVEVRGGSEAERVSASRYAFGGAHPRRNLLVH